MIIFFSIPMWLIAFILLALVALGIEIATQMIYVLFFTSIIIYWTVLWMCWVLYSKKERKLGIICVIDSALCVLGFFVSLFAVQTFYKTESGVKTLLLLLIFGIIFQVIVLFTSGISKIISRTIMGIAGLILCIWTIGYDLSYPIKCNDSNIAYYSCVSLEKEEEGGQTFRSIEEAKAWVPARLNGDIYDINGSDVTEIGDEHIIGTYDVGDKLLPGGSVIRYNPAPWEIYPNKVWYTVLTETGEKGYIPSTGIEVYYYRESEDITQKQKEKIDKSWYCWLPSNFLTLCEKFFERLPFGYKYNFSE